MLLEIPEQDLGAAICCLALGTLYALRSGLVPPGTGGVLTWRAMNPLRGKVPPLLIDALNGMDEIEIFDRPGYEQRRTDVIDGLIALIEWILRNQAHVDYDLGWVEDPEAAEADAVSPYKRSGEPRFPYPVDEEQVLSALGSSFRLQSGRESERWATFEDVMGRLGRVDTDQVRSRIDRLLLREQVEEAPSGNRWRPTRVGWDRYHHHRRTLRQGLWDQYGTEQEK